MKKIERTKGRKSKIMEENKVQKTAETRITLHTHTYTYILNNKKTREKFNFRKQQFRQAGITLVALVVTVIVLLILAGVTISLALGGNGILDRTQYASNMYANATKNEIALFENIEQISDKLTGTLTESQIMAINQNTNLQEINYKPAEINEIITIPGENNGGIADQEFSQANLGTQSLKWYVLSADENGVNLVSEPTSKAIQFCDAGGYDNCLYYLKQIVKKLFINENKFGITPDRVHALNLSDIKKATEGKNGQNYNWDETFIKNASYYGSGTNTYNEGKIGKKTYTTVNLKYPKIYGTSEEDILIDNSMYDEDVPEDYKPIKDDLAGSTSPTASKQTVNYTYLSYHNARDAMINNLGIFGSSDIGKELFKENGKNYYLASRSIYSDSSNRTNFFLNNVSSGCLSNYHALCLGQGGNNRITCYLRCVVSISGARINISNDGTVTLK